MSKLFSFSLLFFTSLMCVFAQPDTNDYSAKLFFETSYYQGKLFKIYDVFPESKSASAFDFRVGFLTKGKKYWHQQYNYPEITLTFSYSDYGNKDVLGSSFSIFPSIGSVQYVGGSMQINYALGFGLAYFNKPFDGFTNPTNNVIGSNIVATVSLRTVFEIYISNKLKANLGFSFRHYSDGHIKVPNVGGNLIYLTGGVKFTPNVEENKCKEPEIAINKKLTYKINFGLGAHEVEGTVYPHGGPLYSVYQGTFSVLKRTSYKHRYSIGVNYNYYTDYYDFINSQQVFYEKEKLRSTKLILFLGHEWIFNHLTIEAKVGANIYYPFRHKLIDMGLIQNRWMDNYTSAQFGFNYYLFDSFSTKKINPFIGTSIRTIGGKADFIQLSLGVNFN